MLIQEIRKRKSLLQRDVAKQLGVTVQTVRNWESGRNHPGKRIAKLAQILDCTVADIATALEEQRASEELLSASSYPATSKNRTVAND